jgi:hypothetical protein
MAGREESERERVHFSDHFSPPAFVSICSANIRILLGSRDISRDSRRNKSPHTIAMTPRLIGTALFVSAVSELFNDRLKFGVNAQFFAASCEENEVQETN